MYTPSQSLQAAIDAGSPQRVLIEFFEKPNGDKYLDANNQQTVVAFSNEDILLTDGLQWTFEFNSETDLTIGLCPSAQIRFSLLNDEGQLENFDFGKFRAWIGARLLFPVWGRTAHVKHYVEDGEEYVYEFAPLGVFIAHKPDIIKKSVINVDANDQMTLFDPELPSGVITYTNSTTVQDIVTAICTYVGVTVKVTNDWINKDILVTSQPEQFAGARMREIIGWAAEASCANAMFNRQGQLEFVWLRTVQKTYDEHDYSEFSQTWYETQGINRLHIRNADQTDEIKWPATAPEGTENAYMIQDNPFLRVPESNP